MSCYKELDSVPSVSEGPTWIIESDSLLTGISRSIFLLIQAKVNSNLWDLFNLKSSRWDVNSGVLSCFQVLWENKLYLSLRSRRKHQGGNLRGQTPVFMLGKFAGLSYSSVDCCGVNVQQKWQFHTESTHLQQEITQDLKSWNSEVQSPM